MYQKKCKHFYSCSSPNNITINYFSNYQHLVVVFTEALPLPATHYYWHWQMQLRISQQLSTITPFPFDPNYTCRRVKWGEHGMGPMQHSLTTATPFKSQKILFKARALGSNLIHRRLSTSQLPILDPPSPVTWFTSFLSCPPTPYRLPPSFARFCDTRISSIVLAQCGCGCHSRNASLSTSSTSCLVCS